jgi:hypothetical protein
VKDKRVVANFDFSSRRFTNPAETEILDEKNLIV